MTGEGFGQRAGLALVAFCGLLLFGSSVNASSTYQGTNLFDLWTPAGGSIASVQGITGRQAFGSVQIGPDTLAATWDQNGSVTLMQPVGAALGYYGNSVIQSSGSGVQGGYAVNPENNQDHAMVWYGSANTAVDLNPTLLYGFYSSRVLGVAQNQQVGGGSSVAFLGHALLWTGTPQSAVDLNPAGASDSAAFATDGVHQVGGVGSQAAMWSGTADSYVNLAPTRLGNFDRTTAVALAGDQEVGNGLLNVPFGAYGIHALLWTGTGDSAVDLNPTGWYQSWATATNGHEQVGYGWFARDDQGGGQQHQHALLWTGTAYSAIDLHNLLPPGFVSSQAFNIDSTGDVYGIALDNWGVYHAVEWTPVPEPSALAELSVVFPAMLLARRRRTRRRSTPTAVNRCCCHKSLS